MRTKMMMENKHLKVVRIPAHFLHYSWDVSYALLRFLWGLRRPKSPNTRELWWGDHGKLARPVFSVPTCSFSQILSDLVGRPHNSRNGKVLHCASKIPWSLQILDKEHWLSPQEKKSVDPNQLPIRKSFWNFGGQKIFIYISLALNFLHNFASKIRNRFLPRGKRNFFKQSF